MGERVQVGLTEVSSLIRRWRSYRWQPCHDPNIFVTERFLCFLESTWSFDYISTHRFQANTPMPIFLENSLRKAYYRIEEDSLMSVSCNYETELITSFLFWNIINAESFCVVDVHIHSYLANSSISTGLQCWGYESVLISVASWHPILQNSWIVQIDQIFHVSPFDQETQALLTHLTI